MASLFKRKRKGGYVWYVTYFQHGKPKMKSTGTGDKKLATEVLNQVEGELVRASHGLEPTATLTPVLLSEFIGIYLEDRKRQKFAPKTVDMDRAALRALLAFTGDCSITTITKSTAKSFKEYRLECVKPASVSIELRSIRAAFNWGIEKPSAKYLHQNSFIQKG